MLNVNVESGPISHPSMFQTPLAVATPSSDPDELWINPLKRKVPCTGPAIHPRTRKAMIKAFNNTQERPDNSMTPTLLFALFFSRENMDLLQKSIRSNVFRWTGIRVGEQADTDLRQAMHSVFSRFARHVDEQQLAASVVLTHLKNEVARLDDIVVEESTQVIAQNIQAYKGYADFTTKPRQLLEPPLNTKITGTKIYRTPTDVIFGKSAAQF